MTSTQFAPIVTLVDPDRPDDNLSGRLAAATCRWLLLIAEFDRRNGCAQFGLHTTAYWLSHHCGIAPRTAVEHVRVAKALVAFPQLAEQMSAGRVVLLAGARDLAGAARG